MKRPPLGTLLALVFVNLALVSACAPTVELGCKADDDCAPGRHCAAGRCVGETGLVDAGAGGPR